MAARQLHSPIIIAAVRLLSLFSGKICPAQCSGAVLFDVKVGIRFRTFRERGVWLWILAGVHSLRSRGNAVL